MNTKPTTHTTLIDTFRQPIETIARCIAQNRADADDLRQEMYLHLLTMPPGQTRAWCLRRLSDRAKNYRARNILDVPIHRGGRPILERQTVAVGGLAELDEIHRRQMAA